MGKIHPTSKRPESDFAIMDRGSDETRWIGPRSDVSLAFAQGGYSSDLTEIVDENGRPYSLWHFIPGAYGPSGSNAPTTEPATVAGSEIDTMTAHQTPTTPATTTTTPATTTPAKARKARKAKPNGKGKPKASKPKKASKAAKLRFKRTRSGTVAIESGKLTDRQALSLTAETASAILMSDKIGESAKKAASARADSLAASTLKSGRYTVTGSGVKVGPKDVQDARNHAIARANKALKDEGLPELSDPVEIEKIMDRAVQSLYRAALKTDAQIATAAALTASAVQIGIKVRDGAANPRTTREGLRAMRAAYKAAKKAAN